MAEQTARLRAVEGIEDLRWEAESAYDFEVGWVETVLRWSYSGWELCLFVVEDEAGS